jgi:hypothetical protein
MKTKMLFAVLFVTLFGCREIFVDICAGEYRLVTTVVIEGGGEDGISAVPVGDETNIVAYKIRAHVVNGRRMNLIQNVEWRISDPSLVRLATVPADPESHLEATAIIETLADILDRGGASEPEATITACIQNDCAGYLGGEDCATCVPEVCSAPHTVRAVVNAEGFWELQGATFPFTVQLAASQTGRTLEAISSYYRPEINGRQIEFWADDWHYIGEFTDREHVVGRVVRDSTGEDLGEWTADKCPDTGCAPP